MADNFPDIALRTVTPSPSASPSPSPSSSGLTCYQQALLSLEAKYSWLAPYANNRAVQKYVADHYCAGQSSGGGGGGGCHADGPFGGVTYAICAVVTPVVSTVVNTVVTPIVHAVTSIFHFI